MGGHDPNCCGLQNGECYCDHTDKEKVPQCEICPHSKRIACKKCGKKTLDYLLSDRTREGNLWVEKCYLCGFMNRYRVNGDK